MQITNLEKSIPNLTGILVLVIAICSFALSFYNLQAAASESGINFYLSYLFPITVDCLMIAASLMILRSNIRGESSRIGWTVLVTFTLVSIVFNVSQSDYLPLSVFSHCIPPISLCISTELLMMIIRSDLVNSEHLVNTEGESVTPEADTRDMVVAYFEQYPDSTIAEAARVLGFSRTTITKYKVKE